jgi:hypothetical protein
MIKLSRQMDMPNLLVCSAPLSRATQAFINDPVAVSLILTWIQSSKLWRLKIEKTLQGLAQDTQGRALLTAYMPIADLVMLGEDLHMHGLRDMRAIFEEWQSMGAVEGNFESYEVRSRCLKGSVQIAR